MINRKLNLSNLKIHELRTGNLNSLVGHGIITGLDLNTKSAQVESFAIVGDSQQHSSEIKDEKNLFGCPLRSNNKPNEQVFRDFGFILEPKNTFILNHELQTTN